MYFGKKDEYISATSGFMSIIMIVILSIVFFNIFIPIFQLENYTTKINEDGCFLDIENY